LPLRVNEIFLSIQGESCHAGWPCAFVRLAGCNLRCTYCDTRYAYDEGGNLTVPEILGRVRSFGCPLVQVTGGEPLIQEETPSLVAELLHHGLTVLVETNGSLDINLIDGRAVKIVDFKCPSSGQSDFNDLENIERLGEMDEVKLVIGNKEDYEFAKDIAALVCKTASHGNTVHFSPVFGVLEPRQLAEWMIEDRLWVHLNMQLHKYIWDPGQRGV
jgi:7-carboxy-7-deazaguanine synthase